MLKKRSQKGTILFLIALATGLIIAVGVIGFIFNSFIFGCTRAQYYVDALALSMATTINAGDRVGQINHLEGCSRELVFESRANFERCNEQDIEVLKPLCFRLLEEARDGQQLVEHERRNQITLISKELQRIASDHNKAAARQGGILDIRWLQASQPQIETVLVGQLGNTESSVLHESFIPELADFDMSQGYIDKDTNLFKGNVDAKLPDDDELHFYISRLPAYVKGTCAPARNTNADVFAAPSVIFKDRKPAIIAVSHIPNAVQIICTMNTQIGTGNEGTVRLVSTGVTYGATAGSQ